MDGIDESCAVGIDLGGTHVRVGVVSSTGEVLDADATSVSRTSSREAFVDFVASTAGRHDVRAVGIGASGPVDPTAGVIDNPNTLPAHLNGDIIRPLERRLNVPAVLVNDAAAALIGELWLGAGREAERAAMVTLGTGIGVAWASSRSPALAIDGEAGHHLIDPGGPPCYCGGRGCWESLCSAMAIVALARTRLNASPQARSSLRSADPLTCDAIASAARAGDAIAGEILDEVAGNLGRGLVNVISLLVPDLVILSGGLTGSYDLLEARVNEVVDAHAVALNRPRTPVVLSTLGDRAGVLGAARLAFTLLVRPQADSPTSTLA